MKVEVETGEVAGIGVVEAQSPVIAGGDVAVAVSEEEDVLFADDQGIVNVLDAHRFPFGECSLVPGQLSFRAACHSPRSEQPSRAESHRRPTLYRRTLGPPDVAVSRRPLLSSEPILDVTHAADGPDDGLRLAADGWRGDAPLQRDDAIADG